MKKLSTLIFLAMGVGVALGLGLWTIDDKEGDTFVNIVWTLDLLGPTLFVGALKMIVAPLILTSIVAGVTSLANIRQLGSIGTKALLYYGCTTSIAVSIGLAAVLIIAPGESDASQKIRSDRAAELETRRNEYTAATEKSALEGDKPTGDYLAWLAAVEGKKNGEGGGKYHKLERAEARSPKDIFKNDLLKPLLMNPFQSVASSPPNSLGIIFFSLLFGIACTLVGKPARPVVEVFQSMNLVIMKITHWLMSISPFAIMCLTAGMVAKNGPEVFESLGAYCITVISGIAAHVVMLLLICTYVAKVGPRKLWAGLKEAWIIAFTTRSSAATLPVTLNCLTKNLKASPKVANFTLPLGATVNMDGTALYEGVAVIFLIQIYGPLDDVGIQMTAMITILIFITAVLASVGAAAVPDAGLVTMVLVASAVHLPIYYIPLIFAVDAFLDMFRTSTNVLGDAVGTLVVDRFEKKKEAAAADASEDEVPSEPAPGTA